MHGLLSIELSYVNKDFGYNHEIWHYNLRVSLTKTYKFQIPRIHTIIHEMMAELGKDGDFSPGHVVKIHKPLVAFKVIDGLGHEYNDYRIDWYVPGND